MITVGFESRKCEFSSEVSNMTNTGIRSVHQSDVGPGMHRSKKIGMMMPVCDLGTIPEVDLKVVGCHV